MTDQDKTTSPVSRAVSFGRMLRDLRETRAAASQEASASGGFLEPVFGGELPESCDDFLARGTGEQIGALLEYAVDPAEGFEYWANKNGETARLTGRRFVAARPPAKNVSSMRAEFLRWLPEIDIFAAGSEEPVTQPLRDEINEFGRHVSDSLKDVIRYAFETGVSKLLARSDLEILDVLTRLADKRVYSMRAVAARAGFTHGYLSQVESGKILPSEKAVHALAADLGVAANVLFSAAGIVPKDLSLRLQADDTLLGATQALAAMPYEKMHAIARKIREGEW